MTTNAKTCAHTNRPLTCHAARALDNTGGRDWCIADKEGRIVGEAFQNVGAGPHLLRFVTRPAEANARLWAASPDLLIACQEVEFLADACREGRLNGDEAARALIELSGTVVRSAISKARGQ